MRIAVGGIEHESTTFLTGSTAIEAFNSTARAASAEQLAARSGTTNTIIDGLIRGVRENGAQLVPLHWCFANSGSQPTFETHRILKTRLIDALVASSPVNGVLLSLHGAYSAKGIDDGDGDILQAVRSVVGSDCPIMAVHDLHCNISQLSIDHADALLIEKTYPHTDMAERGRAAAKIMVQTIQGTVRPTMAWCSLPLFWAAPHMITAVEPMKFAIDELLQLETQPNVLSASIGVGYQWADVPCAGVSTVVVTDDAPDLAQQHADRLGRWVWERRDLWQRVPLRAAAALNQGEQIGKYPIILADQADNPGGGAPSDSTAILRLFLDRKLDKAAVLYMCDPETVHDALRVGVGRRGRFCIGGKAHPLSGTPVELTARVASQTDGRFTYDGPMFAQLEGHHGDSVLLQKEGISIVVTSIAQQPIDLAFCRTLGLDCGKLRYIAVKSTGHFRSGFEPIAGSIFNVDEPAPFTQDFSSLPFDRLGRKVFPMHPDAEPAWSSGKKP